MSVQPTIITSKQQNQSNRERLNASYSEGVTNNVITTSMTPRDVYIYRGLDKNRLKAKPSINGLTSAGNKSILTGNILQRYKQSMAPSKPAYRSSVTMDEALTPPWALSFNIKRQPATPNFLSNSMNSMPVREEPPRRLMSAPLVRSPTPTAALRIPEPCFVTAPIPIPQTTTYSSPLKSRPSSALAYHDTTDSSDNKQQHHEIKSAPSSHRDDDTKLFDEKTQQISEDKIEQPIEIIFTKSKSSSIPPPPIFIYKKSATRLPDEGSTAPLRKSIEVSAIPLNPYYIHRPGVIGAQNFEKKPLEKENSASKGTTKPLLPLTPRSQKSKLSLETDSIKLTYDPKLTLDDKSPNLSKYLIDGRLYLIKDHRYNVVNNIDPSILQKYNQNSTSFSRPKYYQTVSVDKLQPTKPPQEVHYNAAETFFYNTIPKRSHRYVVHPNFISENLNVNRVSLGKRPPTTTIYA